MSENHVCPPDRTAVRYMALVVDSYNCDVLVNRQGSKVTFPRVDCPEIPHRGRHMSDCFSRALERLTGTQYELVFLYATINETYQRHLSGMPRAIFECLGPTKAKNDDPVDPASKEYEWMSISSIEDSILQDNLEWVDDVDMCGYSALVRGDSGEFSEKRLRPWELPRWFKDTTEIAASTLADLKYTVTTAFEQHQISPSSAILRVDTNKGRVYLKASTKREAITVQCAASFAPFLVRKPLHVNVEKEWMLMEDYGPTLNGKFSRCDFENILILHGKLQLESVQHVPELIHAGIPRQGPESIMIRTQRMLDDPEIRQSYTKVQDFVPPDDGGQPDLTKCCETVSDFLKHIYNAQRLPLALVHGDLYDDNIIKTHGDTGSYVVYDWGNARIDIPFSDVVHLETEVTTRDGGRKDGIDAYLELWAEYGSLSQLRKLCHCVTAKDDLVRLLGRYEYAKDKRIHPGLEDTDIGYLQNTLVSIKKQCLELNVTFPVVC